MIFSPKRKKYTLSSKLYIENEEIKPVNHTKFLGVMVDESLNWDFHINYIKNKVAKGIGILSKARQLLNKNCLRTLYFSFLYPYLNYCIEVWGSATCSRLQPLVKLQKKAIRIITLAGYHESSEPLFLSTNILPLSKIHVFKIALSMFNMHHDKTPVVFNDMFVLNDQVHSYNTRHKKNLHVPLAKSNYVKNTIRIQGVKIWNYLLDKISINCSINTFKSSLRKLIANNIDIVNLIK